LTPDGECPILQNQSREITMPDKVTNVYSQMQKVQKAMSVKGIAKTDYNDFGKFHFRGIDQAMNVLGPVLAEHDLMIIPKVVSKEVTRVRTTQDKPTNHWVAEVSYTFVATGNVDNAGFKHETTFCGEAYDSSDKGLNKACTAAYKTMMFEVFCIPVEGSDDADGHNEIAADGPISPEEKAIIVGLCDATKTPYEGFATWLGYNDLDEVPATDFAKAKNALMQKVEMQKQEQPDVQSEVGETK
jgi:hypothetical protein